MVFESDSRPFLPLVYQYVWRNYSFAAQRGWIFTLRNDQAIAFVACVTTFIAYSQSRAWRIERDILNRLTLPKVQLPTTNSHDTQISQGEAIHQLIRTLLRKREIDIYQFRQDSLWIGLMALINLAVFLAIGIILPWSLVRGHGPSLVRSAATSECKDIQIPLVKDWRALPAYGRSWGGSDASFRQCWLGLGAPNTKCSGIDGISTDRPRLDVSRVGVCPFQGDTCLSEMRPVILEQKGLIFSDYGLNAHSKLSINRRLTCAHLTTPKFTNVSSDCKETIIAFCDWELLERARGSNYNISSDWKRFGVVFNTCWDWRPL